MVPRTLVVEVTMRPIPVFLIDANTAFRRLVVYVLKQHFSAEITLLLESDTWPVPVIPAAKPAAVLLGLGAEGLVKPQVLAAIQTTLVGVPIIVLGHLDDGAYHTAALATGVAAFVAKDTLWTELVPVLRQCTDHSSLGAEA